MANKFQTAMPGALFGTDHLISFLLTHFYLLYAGVILFSAAELIVGAMLMTGLLTRLAAVFSMGFSVLLMADVRLAGRHLHRRVDDGGLQSGDGRNACCSRAAAPARSTMSCFGATPLWPESRGSAGRRAACRCRKRMAASGRWRSPCSHSS